MAAKKILMLVGDYAEDYEVMVPFQTFPQWLAKFLEVLGTRIEL